MRQQKQPTVPDGGNQGKQPRKPRLVVTCECRLEGVPEDVRAAIRERLTINNPKYMDAKRYSRWVGKNLKPKLYFFKETSSAIVFPRGFANRAVVLCRRLIGRDPEIVDRRRKLEPLEFTLSTELRPYQEEAVQAMARHAFGVLEATTGAGKTVMALGLLARRRQPTLVLVHSKELLHQWRGRIRDFLGISVGQVGDGRREIRPVTVAIVNSARRLREQLVPCFGQVIVDECHRVPASLFTQVVSAFDAYYLLGLSATAFRREDGMTRIIYAYMGDRVHVVGGRELAASGAVVMPVLEQRPTGFSCPVRGDYPRLIKALAADSDRNRQIVTDVGILVEQGHSGTILLVSDRVAHCELLQRLLQEQGVEAALLTGRMPSPMRARIVRDVQEGRVVVLIATLQLIGEGFDCSGLSTLVLATPIRFEGRLLQVVGRIMRPASGKKAVVIDYVDVRVPTLRRSAEARQRVFSRL